MLVLKCSQSRQMQVKQKLARQTSRNCKKHPCNQHSMSKGLAMTLFADLVLHISNAMAETIFSIMNFLQAAPLQHCGANTTYKGAGAYTENKLTEHIAKLLGRVPVSP